MSVSNNRLLKAVKVFFGSLRVALAGLLLLSLQPLAVEAGGHFGMVWTHQQFNDAFNQGRETSTAVIGFPETDNVLGAATCFVGSTAGLPRMELAGEIGPAREGDPVDIEFFSDSGPMLYRGEAKVPLSDEDFSGVRFFPGFNDPLWGVLQRMNEITYRVGAQTIVLPLRGSRRVIDDFLNDCRFFHDGFDPDTAGGGQQSPAPVTVPGIATAPQSAFDPRWATCDTMAGVVSQRSDIPVTVTFRNRSDGYRGVLWIGFDGVPRDYAGLNPGEEFTINTFVTHPWMFTDGPGNCLEMFMPIQGVPVFDITAPNRDFGPE